MNFRPYFSEWAREVNRFLSAYLKKRAREVGRVAPIAADLISDFADFIVGGKRLRAGLVKLGYEIFGGKNPRDILPIAAGVEIFQGGILIHDDVIDRDPIRHNKPTIHERYKKRLITNHYPPITDAAHYGESMAILAGDFGLYEAISLIASSSFHSSIKERVLQEFVRVALDTMYGQALDVELVGKSQITEEEVMTLHRLKAAFYSVVGPLSYGALSCGGVGKRELAAIQDYGLPIGIAYQLQDDILDMFGSEEKTGKPTDSDIKEGKNTLLYLETFRKSGEQDQKFLKVVWGNPNVTPKEVQKVRELMKTTGALGSSQNLAKELVKKAQRAIPKLTKNKDYQIILGELADYIIERKT